MNFPNGLSTPEASDWAFDNDCNNGIAWRNLAEAVGVDTARKLYKIAFLSAAIWSAERMAAAGKVSSTAIELESKVIDERLGIKPIV